MHFAPPNFKTWLRACAEEPCGEIQGLGRDLQETLRFLHRRSLTTFAEHISKLTNFDNPPYCVHSQWGSELSATATNKVITEAIHVARETGLAILHCRAGFLVLAPYWLGT